MLARLKLYRMGDDDVATRWVMGWWPGQWCDLPTYSPAEAGGSCRHDENLAGPRPGGEVDPVNLPSAAGRFKSLGRRAGGVRQPTFRAREEVDGCAARKRSWV